MVKYLFISGNLSGGALSAICAYDFANEINSDNLIHYSFACPKVGNQLYVKKFN